ncbi:hypothetical protein FBU59_003166 [Linderina macrospora]|uniref:Uncharacterized protein n=1 Tax=Linderina macrospora TaxID=4868 RepID=A0ACC1J994_9FUNG|nr:hypothetical protein FBU59_003166 [Linderina macrospora]
MRLFVPAILALAAVSTAFADQQQHNNLLAKREPDVAGFFSDVGAAVDNLLGHAAEDETTPTPAATSKVNSKESATSASPTSVASTTTKDDGEDKDATTTSAKTSKTKESDETKASSTPKTTATTDHDDATTKDDENDENDEDTDEEDNNATSATGEACSKENEIQCVGTNQSTYRKCDGSNWIAQTCGSGNVCGLDDAGKTACITKAAANREKCSTKGQQRCVGTNSPKYQECNGNVWVDSKCGKQDFCIAGDNNTVKCGTSAADATSVPYTMVGVSAFVPNPNTASSTMATMAVTLVAAFTIALVAGI